MYGYNHPERIRLCTQIQEWNANRLDLFEISEPNEYLEFYGVMRFFYQGEDLRYQTKCLRVSSTATTIDLIDALVQKFHPDLKMLSNDRHALYENHNIQDRKMKDNEYPLIVQLNWAFDDKDGKFILKNESRRRRSTDLTGHAMLNNYGMSKSPSTSALGSAYDNQTLRSQSSAIYSTSSLNFFSKKMSLKKSRRKSKSDKDSEESQRLAAELSGKPPESSFTRTISNPDEVMKRRRQRKLEIRLEQFSGDSETGGTLKIYGDSINPDIPYKTLLLSVNDTAEKVLNETLDKYGLAQEDHRFYVLVQQNVPPKNEKHRGEIPEEIILHDQDCPLGILVHCPPRRGNATFAVRRRTAKDRFPSKPRMPPYSFSNDLSPKSPGIQNDNTDPDSYKSISQTYNDFDEQNYNADYPRLVKVSIDDDGNLFDEQEIFTLRSLISNETKDCSPPEGSKFIKIGSQLSSVGKYPNILLSQEYYQDIRPTHCHISAKADPQNNAIRFTLTPTLDSSSRVPKPCLVYINQQKIEKSTKLRDEDIIQIGEMVLFRFEESDEQKPENISSNVVLDHMKSEDTIESIQINYLTADLPVTIKHSYNYSEDIIDTIMQLSKDYADKGSKSLFSSNVDPRFPNLDELFKLAPAYMIYLLLRSALGKDQHVANLINIVAQNIEQIIQEDKNSIEKETFWLSNASELLHLLQCDNDLRNFSGSAQDILASAIEQAFSILQIQFSQDLLILLPAFINIDDSDLQDNTREDSVPCLDRATVLINFGEIDFPIQHLMQTLSLAYTLFHNCQVNVALTIQMFSQLFHLLNTWLFNSVLGDPSNPGNDASGPLPVSPEWGERLSRRLTRIRNWSETNGLEMAANCHLQKMYQVTELMEADKRDLNVFGEKCLDLVNINGVQLHFLLDNCEDTELPNAWIEVVVNTAIQWHDQAFNGGVPQNKKNLPLYDDLDLRLPLLLPADGYCCDRGIVSCPKDLRFMLDSLKGLLSYKLNPPILNDIDTRWKSYLGSYEHTPSVSRSGTIIEQSPVAPLKIETQHKLPRNWVSEEHSSMILSSPDMQYDYQKYPKDLPTPKAERPKQLPIGSHSLDFSDDSDGAEVYKGNLKNRYKLKLKKINNSLGLSIIAAKASPSEPFRIYVKEVIPDGAGFKSGKIECGDQLVSVDGTLLENINQEQAVDFMKKTKPVVNLVMDKGAATRNGVMDIILKSRSVKTAMYQSNKKLPDYYTIPKSKQIPGLKSSLSKSFTNLDSSHRQPSENVPVKKHSQLENQNKKRTEYNLPHLPQKDKAPPRPVRAPSKNRPLPKPKSDDESDHEYNSLPIRKTKVNKQQKPNDSIYSTVKQKKPVKLYDDTTYNSLQRSKPRQSSSQPNLSFNIPKKRADTPDSFDSSSSESVSTSDEKDSVENKPPVKIPVKSKRTNVFLLAKLPQPPKESPVPPKLPVKALSDNNIQLNGKGIPRQEIKSSPKKQVLTRPVIAPDSDEEPTDQTNSESSIDKLSLKNQVKLINKSAKSKSSSSESDSESETLSSISQSFSSDPSPVPQRKMNSEPILSVKQTEPIPNPKFEVKLNGKIPNVVPPNITKKDEQKTPSSTVNQPPLQPKITKEIPSKPSVKASLPTPPTPPPPPPLPTAIHPQYHPPSSLEENNWSTSSSKPVNKPQNDDEIKMRRKAIEDKIRKETEIHDIKDRVSSPTDSRSESLAVSENSKASPNRTSARYGRPQFNDSKQNRPESQNKIPNNNNSINATVSSPTVFPKGIIVPASPANKSLTIGTKEVYKEPFKLNQNNQKEQDQEHLEQLSFKEKMQLFSQKNGENQVVNRNKFSSKQRKIESGDFS